MEDFFFKIFKCRTLERLHLKIVKKKYSVVFSKACLNYNLGWHDTKYNKNKLL